MGIDENSVLGQIKFLGNIVIVLARVYANGDGWTNVIFIIII